MTVSVREWAWHPLALGLPPAWADAWGGDRFGPWVAIRFDEVEQRMRWIPAGSFVMGSPEDEAGRFDRETQHEVELTEGFWLFDTPCTQGLWKAVMGENPCRFVSDDRPVEQVSWEDCEAFISKINQERPGLNLGLPTEAQWEYACRAGTAAATYAGDLDIKGARNAPILDEIAWYAGNSGVEFDLDDGFYSSGWSGKQFPHTKAGTRKVAEKKPNLWGLHDMLGNVFEWCVDYHGEYEAARQVDPVGPEKGSFRVLRGGGWASYARLVRAAYRGGNVPDFRYNYLGFRCARVQKQQEPE
ncbi:MAG: formylglycine-generating enzyme family protein [Verrucomicrobiota bacterium]